MRLASVFRFLGRALFLVLALALCALITLRVLAALREDQSLADALPAEGRLVATSMGDIYVEELGPEEGPALLLFHGSVGWSRLWRPTQEVLAAAGWRTIAFDMPPMGFSARDPVRGYDRTTQARRVRALVQAMGLRPVLVAHSFGAGAAAEAAMLDPSAYAGLLVVSGAIGLGSQADAPLPFPLQSAWVRQLAVAATANNPYATRALIRLFLFQKDSVDANLLAVLRRPGRREGSTRALAEWLPSLLSTSGQALSIRSTSWQDLAVPLALVWGDRDTTTPLAQGQILSELAAAPLFILQEVGHIPQIEAPDAFHAALIKALAAVQPSF